MIHETVDTRSFAASLWRNANFMKLWAGQSISLFGTHITLLALPLAAISDLQATPLQMGVMQMAHYLPFLLFGLLAGVWVDRLPRRPVLLLADVGRALALAVIPLAAWNGWLRIEILYIISFVVGTLNLFFEAAYAAFLPQIVPPKQLGEGNGKIQSSAAAAEVVGPGMASWLIQWFTAPLALLWDAGSFVLSAIAFVLLRVEEPQAAPSTRRSIWYDLREGLGVVLRNGTIRALAFCSGSSNMFINMHIAIYVLYLKRDLGMATTTIGLIYSIGGIGGLLGALYASTIARRIGLGRAIIGETQAVGFVATVIPFITLLGSGLMVPLLIGAQVVWSFWLPLYVVNAASLRQTITPNHLLGRVTAASRFISWGAAAIGFLIGGYVAEQIGIFPTLIIAGIGLWLSSLWVVLSPVRSLTTMPETGSVVE